MQRIATAALLGAGLATAVLAHEGVQNPLVEARMDLMAEIGRATSRLGKMAKGELAFDAAEAQAAADAIAAGAAEIPAVFEAKETDPASETLPVVWQQFGDFAGKAEALEAAARAASISGKADLPGALRAIGGTCRDCHEAYRE